MHKLTIPNQITIARIILIFIFLALANVGRNSLIGTNGLIHISENATYICHVTAYILAIIAGLTDILDGYIARKFNMISEFGQLIDPLADKIFITATFIMMVEKSLMPGWMAVVVISREFLVTGLRLLAVSKSQMISADSLGKLKTFLQMMMLLTGGAAWIKLFNLQKVIILWHILLWTIVCVTVYSGVSYFVKHRYLYMED